MGNYKFDLDLPEGIAGEDFIKDLLSGDRGKIEVKRDFIVSSTGNIAIEYECRGQKSGIAKTEAMWWAIICDGNIFAHQLILFISTKRLKEIALKYYRSGKHTNGGDDNKSKMILVPISEFVKRRYAIPQYEFI